MKSKIVGFSLSSVLVTASLASLASTVGCSGSENQKFTGSIPGQALDESRPSLEDQSAVSKDSVSVLRAETRANNALIEKALEGLRQNVAELKEKDKELQQQITDLDTKLSERISRLEQRVTDLEKQDVAFAEKLGSLQIEVTDVKSQLDAAEASYNLQLSALSEVDRANAVTVATLEKQLGDTKVEIVSRDQATRERIEALQTDLATNYATKSELKAVKDAQDIIKRGLTMINSEVTEETFHNLRSEDAAFSAVIERLASNFNETKISIAKNAQTAADAAHKNSVAITKLDISLESYQAEFFSYKKSIEIKMTAAKADASAGKANTKALAELVTEIAKMNAMIACGEKGMSESLAMTLESLKDGSPSSVNMTAVQAEFSRMISDRQIYETTVSSNLSQLSGRMEAVEKLASSAYAMSLQNKEDIAALKATLLQEVAKLELGISNSAKLSADEVAKVNERVAGVELKIKEMQGQITDRLAGLENDINNMLDGKTSKEFAESFRSTFDLAKTNELALASLQDSIKGRIMDILKPFQVDMGKRLAEVEGVQSAMNEDLPAAIPLLQDYSNQSWEVAAALIEVLAPYKAQKDSSAAAFEAEFKSLMKTECKSLMGADFANMFGKDYFTILAMKYNEALAFGKRSGTPDSDGIFFGADKVATPEELFGLSVAPMFEITSRGGLKENSGEKKETGKSGTESMAECSLAVDQWADSILFGEKGSSFRLTIVNSVTIKNKVVTLVNIGRSAKKSLDKVEKKIKDGLPGAVATLQVAVAQHARELMNVKSEVAATRQQLSHQAELAAQLIEARESLAEANTNQEGKVAEAARVAIRANVNEMKERFASVEAGLRDLGAEFTKFKVAQTGTNSELYGMIAAIAAKSGLGDIATEARKKSLPYLPDGVKIPEIVGRPYGLGIHAVSHYFDLEQKTNYAGGMICYGNNHHGNQMIDPVRWFSGSACVVNMRVTGYNENALDGKNLTARVVFTGVAEIALSSKLSKATEFTERRKFVLRTTPAQPVSEGLRMVSGDWIQGIVDLNITDAVKGFGPTQVEPRTLRVRGYAQNGEFLNEVSWELFLYSPVVLNFAGSSSVTTSSFVNSNVRFDMDGDGAPENTGWLAMRSSSGFLAMDRNGNGKIDDGTELFGEATRMAKGAEKTAQNGYVALAQLDANHDGRVDAKDPEFNKLQVWFDRNLDGKTDANELVAIAQAGVTALATNYQEVKDPSQRAQSVVENDTRYESRFWGPEACGTEGCSSFDIYFSRSSEVAKK